MSKVLEKQKVVEVNGKSILFKKLPIGKVIKILNSLEKLPDEFVKSASQNNEEFIKNLPLFVATAIPSFADIIVRAVDDTSVTQEWLIDECGFDDVMIIVENLLEINNVADILQRIKKVKSLVNQS